MLDAEQRDLLKALADTIVPASNDGRMPIAGDLGFPGYLVRNAPELLPELTEMLAGFGTEFGAQPAEMRHELVKAFSEREPESFHRLLAQVYGCYYQDDRVLEAIGLDAGPPFPRGNTLDPGDLSLLDPVLENPGNWRRHAT